MSQKNAIAKHFVSYSFTFVFMQAITIALAVFIRNALGPEQMGVWVALQVALAYTKYSNLGLAGAAGREIPYERGRGNFARVENIRFSAFTFTLAASGFLSFGMAAFAMATRGRFGELFFVSLAALAVLSLFQRVSTFCISMVRAEKKFEFINRFNVYSTLVNAAATVVLVTFFGLYGYYASMVLSVVFNFFYLVFFSGVRFGLRLDWAELRGLFKMGVALIAVNMLSTLLDSVDKLSISTLIGLKALGVYSVAFMASNLVMMVPNNLSVIIFPYLNEAYGATQSTDVMKRFVIKPNLFLALYMPMAISVGWIFSGAAVRLVMPGYADGIWPLKICMFGTLFMLMASGMGNTLVTFKKYLWMIPTQAVIAAAAFGANFVAIRMGAGLVGVSLVEMVQYLLLYACYASIAFRATGESALLPAHLGQIAGLAAYYLAPLVCMDLFLPQEGRAFVLLRLGVMAAFFIPAALFGEKRYRTAELVRRAFQKRPAEALAAAEAL